MNICLFLFYSVAVPRTRSHLRVCFCSICTPHPRVCLVKASAHQEITPAIQLTAALIWLAIKIHKWAHHYFCICLRIFKRIGSSKGDINLRVFEGIRRVPSRKAQHRKYQSTESTRVWNYGIKGLGLPKKHSTESIRVWVIYLCK